MEALDRGIRKGLTLLGLSVKREAVKPFTDGVFDLAMNWGSDLLEFDAFG